MRKTILYLAISLDGFIAKVNHQMDWLTGMSERPNIDTGYEQFYASIDTLLMGYTTYEQIVEHLSPDAWPYPSKQSYVFTSQILTDKTDISFINNDPIAFVEKLKQQPGGDIWLVGGATLADAFIAANAIDTYIIAIIPTLLGDGIPLFLGDNPEIKLNLIQSKSIDGIVELTYEPRL